MGAYEIVAVFRSIVGHFGAKAALAIALCVALFFALRSSVSWFFEKVVSLLGEWVRSQTEEKRALLQQNQQYASQIQTFLHNHLEHLSAEREEFRADMAKRDDLLAELSKGQVKMNGMLHETMEEVRGHRAEDQRRAEAA
jgi:hypothetical protein